MASNPPGPVHPAPAPATGPDPSQQQLGQNMRRAARRYGLFHPRWPLLAAAIFMPLAIIGNGIKLYFASHPCTLGGLCSLDMLPGIVQMLLIWVAYFVLWVAVSFIGHPLEVVRDDHLRPVETFLKHVSNYLAVGPLVVVYAAVVMLELLLTLLIGRLDPVVIALSAILFLVAGCILAPPRRPHAAPVSEDVRRAAQIGRAAGAAFRMRSMAVIGRLIPARANRRPPAPPGGTAAATGTAAPPNAPPA